MQSTRRSASGPTPRRAPYEQVKAHLKARLARGEWPPGALMPSESELVAQFGVSRMTVNRALREMQLEGLVDRIKGSGTYAAQLYRVSSTLTIRDIHEEILSRGHVHEARVHHVAAIVADASAAERLGVAPGVRLFHSVVVHLENGVPIQCEDRLVNPRCAPDYLQVDFTRVTPTHYLLEVAPLWKAHFRVQAGLPTRTEARLLGLKTSDPCLIVERRTMNRKEPITWARLVHPAGHYQIEGEFEP